MISHSYTTVLHSAFVLFISFHTSQSCAEWNIVNPPIVFGQTARLSCLVEFKTSNYSTPTWTGGPNYSTISFHGSTADKKKYRVTIIHGDDQFESVLEIFDFGESDVNCDYSCSFGFHENRKILGLTEKHFVFPAKPETTTVLSTLRNGHLDIILELRKVYPVPKCQVLLNGEEVTNRVKTHVRMNGMFYSMNETLYHYLNNEECTGHVTISCNMGVKHFSVYKKTLNTCTGVKVTTNKEHTRSTDSNVLGGSIVVVILALICIVALVAISKYTKLKEIFCCNLSRSRENTERGIPFIVQASKH